jgi:hypothetical protein
LFEVNMQNKKQRPHQHGGKANDIRWLITAISLTSTLFFWYMFSRQQLTSVQASPDPQIAPPPSNGQTNDNPAITLSLPPMPTLVPPLSDLANNIADQPVAALPTAQPQINLVAPAPTQGPVKIMLGGAAPQANTFKPVTRTRSSR